MSFREAVPPSPPNHPPGALPLDPAGGLPFPRPPVPTHLQILAMPLTSYGPVSVSVSICHTSVGTSYGSVSVLCICHKSVFYRNRIICFFAWGLLSTSPTLCFKEIQLSTKITVLPSGTFLLTPGLENFAMVYRLWNVLST